MKAAAWARIAAATFLCALYVGSDAWAAETEAQPRPRKRLPLLVMKQDEIGGRVFLIGDDRRPESGAVNLKILILTPDGETTLQSTQTDAEGSFVLPSLEVGRYRFMIGKLELELEVTEPDPDMAQAAKILPKRILVFLPRSLAEETPE